ncbi:unnamed protein product [Zymoseptoria tritici ST99CH_1A5]|uniref:Dynamin N-terminal domain-containing protein n=1 Tax=Zymoseptoria tritici ST99CH_1A5 TaxID=1276529 RepID=A0A1Y6LPP5_ZYMTR|nr:unnamed protein product [Zymoseptoria tritici ST99CH_1A5]
MAPVCDTALADPLMLDKIDKLFACGVGELVDLPQIVVVGDQSSGKSSVLEGLIRKPLPRDSGLCTRFATQIVFRRAKIEGVEVSIIPDKDADAQHAARGEVIFHIAHSRESSNFSREERREEITAGEISALTDPLQYVVLLNRTATMAPSRIWLTIELPTNIVHNIDD